MTTNSRTFAALSWTWKGDSNVTGHATSDLDGVDPGGVAPVHLPISLRSSAMTDKVESKPAKKDTKRSTKASKGFTDEERLAMRERVQERRGAGKADGESAVLAKLAEMRAPDRAMGERLHAVIKASAPVLSPKLWYGMPAYAKGGKVVCFFQSAQKFNTRYATLGFNEAANLDEGAMWPVAFALKELTGAEEERIGALVKRAAS